VLSKASATASVTIADTMRVRATLSNSMRNPNAS